MKAKLFVLWLMTAVTLLLSGCIDPQGRPMVRVYQEPPRPVVVERRTVIDDGYHPPAVVIERRIVGPREMETRHDFEEARRERLQRQLGGNYYKHCTFSNGYCRDGLPRNYYKDHKRQNDWRRYHRH